MSDKTNAALGAIKIIEYIRSRNEVELRKLVEDEVGDDLSSFMLKYAELSNKKDPDLATKNPASLFILGYMLRALQDKDTDELAATPVRSDQMN